MHKLMTTHIALLRAINVAGYQPVSMAGLRAFATELGLRNVRTLLQSGNLVFETDKTDVDELLEREAKTRLGLETDFIVRTAGEWEKIVARNPFADQAKADAARLHVVFMKDKAKSFAWPGPEIVRVDGRQLYVTYPNGAGRSKLTARVIEKAAGTRGTARNWNTVLKLQRDARIAP